MKSSRITAKNPAKTKNEISTKRIAFDIDSAQWKKFKSMSLEHGFTDVFWGTVADKLYSLMEPDFPSALDLDSEEKALGLIEKLTFKA